jgi:hypothetical protein
MFDKLSIDHGSRGTSSRYHLVFPLYRDEAVAPGL